MSRHAAPTLRTLVAVLCFTSLAWAQSANEVRDLQRILNAERSMVGLAAIAEDGRMGPRTRGAVRSLQEASGLPVTGVGDRITIEVANQGRRAAARQLQSALNRYRAKRGLPAIAVDGKFGPQSRRAVAELQRRRGILRTGRMDVETRAALRAELASSTPTAGGGTPGLVGSLTGASGGPALASGGPELERGDSRKVSLLQTRLNDYRQAKGLSRIGIDGSYGPQTERAVRELQTREGLPATGVTNARTWDALVAATANGPLGRINPAAYPASGARYKRKNTGGANVEIHQLDPIQIGGVQRSPLVFESRMTIDADGAGDAWRSDPWGQPTTSLIYPNGTSLNPTTINYFVLPIGFDARHAGMRIGDIAAVSYRGRVAYAIYGDRGPRTKIGEGSIRLAQKLGIPASPINGGAAGGVIYTVFPGSGIGRPQSQAEINAIGARLLRSAGGNP